VEVKSGAERTAEAFPAGWKVRRLGELGTTYGGLSGKTKRDFATGGARYITFMNIMSNVVLDPATFEPVRVASSEHQARALDGDLFLNGSSETPEEVGMCALLRGSFPDLYLNSFCFGLRLFPDADAVPLYIAYLLRSGEGRKLMYSLAQGAIRYNLSKSAVKDLRVPLPPVVEQKAISESLSDADSLIRSLQQLIAKKRRIKQGAMQALLTGRERLPGFSGQWQAKPLGDLFQFSGGLSASRDQLSTRGHCYLHYGDIHGSSKTYIDVQSEYQDIPKLDISLKRVASTSLLGEGDVVFVDASEDDVGTSKHVVISNKGDTPFISGLHTIVAKSKSDDLDDLYKRHCFQTAAIRTQFYFFAVGTKVSGVSKANIAKVMLPVPPRPEQTAIARILSDMDGEVAALEVKLAKARQLKQGMMQELLTGRTRLR